MSHPIPPEVLAKLPDPIATYEASILSLKGAIGRGELRAEDAEHTLKLLTREVAYLCSQNQQKVG